MRERTVAGLRHLSPCLLALFFVVLGAGSAQAEIVTFTVKNDRGVVLSGVEIARDERSEAPVVDDSYEWDWKPTDLLTGQATLAGIEAGETVWVDRRTKSGPALRPGSVSIAGGFSEAFPATIAAPVTSAMEIVVPSLPLEPYRPELSDCERGVLGLINGERKRLGRQQLYVATTLNAAADAYLYRVQDNSELVANFHELISTPTGRAREMGFPPGPFTSDGDSGVGENLAWESWSPEAVFQSWMSSPPHREAMLDPKYNVAGLGQRDRAWGLELSGVQDSTLREKGGVTDDTGDPDAGGGPTMSCIPDSLSDLGGQGVGARSRPPLLRLKRIGQGGGRVRVRLIAGGALVGRPVRIVAARKRRVCRGRGRSAKRPACRWRPQSRVAGRRRLRRSQVLRLRVPRHRSQRLFLLAFTRHFGDAGHRVAGARARAVIGTRVFRFFG